jgi:hypothetical protein
MEAIQLGRELGKATEYNEEGEGAFEKSMKLSSSEVIQVPRE